MSRRSMVTRTLAVALNGAMFTVLGCGDAPNEQALAPVPPPAPPAPLPPAPAFPALLRPGEIYNAPESLYAFWSPFHGAPVLSRYVVYDDGTFGLQFASRRVGIMEYHGVYTRRDSLIEFKFLVAPGPPSATGVLHGDSLAIKYASSLWEDFVDGVYVRQRASAPSPPTSAIFIGDTNGAVLSRLTSGSRPAWSPDGRQIAFDRDGWVYVVTVDGSGERRLLRGDSPAWSPDGTRIAFTSRDGISVVSMDGADLKTLVNNEDFREFLPPGLSDLGVGKPAWSPNGGQIAFEHLGDGDFQPSRIWVTDSDRMYPRPLTKPVDGRRNAESDPAWSPDGSQLVFWSYGYGIALADASSGSARSLYRNFPTVAYGAKPVFSPDGNSIVFNSGRHLPSGQSIMIMELKNPGSGVKVLIRNAYDASWSPDGRRLAFVSSESP